MHLGHALPRRLGLLLVVYAGITHGASSATPPSQPEFFMEAVRYYERMSVKPNSFKREQDAIVQALARAAFLKAQDPRVVAVLRKTLESLARDPECANCLTPLIAAASGDRELLARAGTLIRERIGSPPNFRGFVNEWTPLIWQMQLPEQREHVGEIAAHLLVATGLRPEEFGRELENSAVLPPTAGPEPVMTKRYLELFGGREFMERFIRDAHAHRLNEALTRLPTGETVYRWVDLETIRLYPEDPRVIALLPRLFEQTPWQDFPAKATLILIAMASRNEALRNQVERAAQAFIDGSEPVPPAEEIPDFQREDWENQIWWNERSGDEEEMGFHMRAVVRMHMPERSRALTLYRLLEMDLGRYSATDANFRMSDGIAELFSRLRFDSKSLRDFVELRYYARQSEAPGQPGRVMEGRVAQAFLRRFYGSSAPQEAMQRWNELELQQALREADLFVNQQGAWADMISMARVFVENRFRPEVRSVLNERLISRWSDCNVRWNLAVILPVAMLLGDEALQSRIITLLRQSAPVPGSLPDVTGCTFNALGILDAAGNAQCSMSREMFAPFAAASIDLVARLDPDLSELLQQIEYFNPGLSEPPAPEAPCWRLPNALLSDYIAHVRGTDFRDALIVAQRDRRETQNYSYWKVELEQVLTQIRKSLEGPDTVPPEQANAWTPVLLRRASDGLAKTFIREALVDETVPEDPLLDRMITIAAMVSDDGDLIATLRTRTERRIRGEDPEFEEACGGEFRSPAERIAYLVRDLAAQTETRPVVSAFIASLSVDPGLLREGLALLMRRKLDSPERRIATEILALLGTQNKNPGTEIAEPGTLRKPVYVYINGGFSPTSDFPGNEESLRSFNKFLFGEEAVLFSGGGRNGLSMPYDPRSSPGGDLGPMVPRVPQRAENWQIETASFAKIESFFTKLGEAAPNELTVILGGHGNRYGLALWDRDNASADRVAGLYRGLPASTTVKTLFMQCYAGAAVIPTARLLPRSIKKLHQYFASYYPEKRCAMATSSEDELGMYLSYYSYPGKPQTFFDGLFDSEPNTSLESLKRRLEEYSEVYMLPVSTSDYFVRDLVTIACDQRKSFAQYLDFDLGAACDTLAQDPVHERTRELRDFDMYQDKPYSMDFSAFTFDVIRRHFPGLPLGSVAEAESVDKDALVAEYLAQGKAEELGLTPDDLDKLVRILGSGRLYNATGQIALSRSPVIRREFESWFRDYLRAPGHQALYGELVAPESAGPDAFRAEQLAQSLTAKMFGFQTARRSAAIPYRRKLRALAETLLKQVPSLMEEAARYRSIRSCERLPLRGI